MGKTCCGPDEAGANNNDPTWRRILWIALGLNAIMFGVEIVAGIAADSRALQADALDFLGDAANYAISLGVAGMALVWRARAALVKAATMLARLGHLGFLCRGVARPGNDGRHRFSCSGGKSRRRRDAVPVSLGRCEHALGVDLFAQRRDR